MKSKQFFYLLLIMAILLACSDKNYSPPAAATFIQSTNTSLISPTDSIPTAIPTLPIEDARKKFLELLSNNGDCHLPCLWGLIPGESSFQEAREVLVPLTSMSDSNYLDIPVPAGSISPRYAEGELEIYTDVRFLVNPNDYTINDISFIAEAHKPLVEDGMYMGYENVFDSTFFSEKASAYMLPQVLSEQGIPESVLLSTSGGPLTRGGTGGFKIALLYPSQGVFVHYETQMYLIGKKIQGCFQSPLVWMELYPPNDTVNFFAQLEKTNWPFFKGGFKPLEETTSVSIDEFYKTFREPTDKCIETPANLWPTPEP